MLFLGGNLSAEVTMYGSNPEFTNAAQQQSVRKVNGTIKDELGEGMGLVLWVEPRKLYILH